MCQGTGTLHRDKEGQGGHAANSPWEPTAAIWGLWSCPRGLQWLGGRSQAHDDAEDVVSRAGLWYEPAQAAGTVLGSAGLVTTTSPVVPALPTSRGVCLCALKTLLEVFHLFICLFSFPECPGLAKLFFTVFRNISSVVCQLQPAGRAGAASGVPAEGGSGTQGARGARGGGKGSGSPKGRRLLPGAARAAPQGVGQP